MIETPLRPRIDLEDGWEFIRKRVGRSWLSGHGGGGHPVALPHCWNASDTFQYGHMSYSGWGAYRRHRTLPIPDTGKGIVWNLRTGGFYGPGEVWFDGRRLARVDGQYLGAAVDLPPLRGATGHLMAFRLDNRWHRNVLPGFRQPDFILHGGLAGGVWMEGLPERHLDTDRISIDCREQESGAELVTIDWAAAATAASHAEITVDWVVTDAAGHPVGAAPVWRGPQDGVQRSATIEISDPRCWSPEDPALYWAEGASRYRRQPYRYRPRALRCDPHRVSAA